MKALLGTVCVVAVFPWLLPFSGVSQAFHSLTTVAPALNAPVGGSGDSCAPVLSPDGRFVLFASTANNLLLNSNSAALPASLPPIFNVFLRDRSNGLTKLVSVNSSGTAGGNGDSLPVQISTNGQFTLFESTASNLVAGDTNNAGDIFLRDLVNQATILVSVDTNGFAGNGASRQAAMTPDGRFVAFISSANNLTVGDTNGIDDVFVRDLQSNTTTLVSVGATARDTNSYNYSSESPDITPDGRFVAFYSSTTNLVTGVPLGGGIYVRDLVAGTTLQASAYAGIVLSNTTLVCFNHRISADGRFICYEAARSSSTLPPFRASTYGWLFRYDRLSDTTIIVHTNAAVTAARVQDVRSLDMTPDGGFIAFVANTNGTTGGTTCVRLWDAISGGSVLVSGNASGQVPNTSACDWPVVDPQGRFVAFLSGPSNLTANAVIGDYHLYLHDTVAGTTTLLDADTNGVGLPITSITVPRITPNASVVAFECADSDVVPNDRNRDSDVFVRDLTTGVSELISAHEATLFSRTPNGPSLLSSAAASADSRYVVFSSEADNLVSNDTNGVSDVFVRDLVNRITTLVSVATNGLAGDGPSREPAITLDGRFVAFTSSADNLTPGDTNQQRDVFVRDLWTGTTTLESVNSSGTGQGNGPSYSPSISPDGRFVLFISKASNLLTNALIPPQENIFLRDRQLASTYALTTRGGSVASMTPDGKLVLGLGYFTGFGSNLFVWNTALAIRTSTNFAGNMSTAAISPNGKSIAFWAGFSTSASDLYAIDLIANVTNHIFASGVAAGAKPAFSFSYDGRAFAYVARVSATNQIFVFDFQTATANLISHNLGSVAPAYGESYSPVISPNGRLVAYRSSAIDLVPGKNDALPAIFLFDRQTGSNTLVSVSQSPLNRSFSPRFSPDGTLLFFGSWAPDFEANDFNHSSDLFSFSLLQLLVTPDPAPGQGLWLSWAWESNRSSSVQYRESLGDPLWHELGVAITNNGLKAYLHDSLSGTNQRFYRVVSQ